MKKINLIFGGLIIGATILSCNKAEVIPEPIYGGSNSMTISEIMDEYLENQTQQFTVGANVAIELTGNQGTRIILSGNNFTDAGGNPLTGNVDIELIEIYKQSAMILTNKVTVASQGGSNEIISSGGEFRITITQGGMPVTIANAPTVLTALTTLGAGNMELFGGVLDAGVLTWNAIDTVTVVPDTSGTMGWYGFPFDGSYSWVNCDYFWSSVGPQTSVKVHLPPSSDHYTTSVYMAFESENAVASLHNYLPSSPIFETGASYSVPEGLSVHFVIVKVDGEQLKYAIQQNTIVTNHEETITTFTDVASMEELEIILDAML